MKRSEMSDEARLAAREGARRRYAKSRDSHARRCYLRLLDLGIKKPRAATIQRWGLTQRDDGSWGAVGLSSDEKKDPMPS